MIAETLWAEALKVDVASGELVAEDTNRNSRMQGKLEQFVESWELTNQFRRLNMPLDLAYYRELLAGWEKDLIDAENSSAASHASWLRDVTYEQRTRSQLATLRAQVAELEQVQAVQA